MRHGRSFTVLLAMVPLAAWILALVAGCGVKGRPVPPEAVRPERIVDLAAAADKGGIRLRWARPERYSEGGKMRDLAGFVVMRAEGDEPLKPLAELPITDRERFQQARSFEYLDAATAMAHAYRYEVISATDDGARSEPSNMVEFTRIAPPPPPNPETFALPSPTAIP
jgi:hypothetical protein